MSEQQAELLTVGQVAERLGVAVHKVVYAVRSRSITPAGRAANVRVFTGDQVPEIRAAVEQIKANRTAGMRMP